MNLLLDEMWSPVIVLQLRRRGYDVTAVAERLELRGQSDAVVFAVAQQEARAVVTENVIDYCPLATFELHQGRSHAGLILTSDRRFPRSDPRTIGRLVSALDDLLARDLDGTNLEHWLT